MTTPDERIRAMKWVNDHLMPAIIGRCTTGTGPEAMKRIPQELKILAAKVCRHYPTNAEIDLYFGSKRK